MQATAKHPDTFEPERPQAGAGSDCHAEDKELPSARAQLRAGGSCSLSAARGSHQLSRSLVLKQAQERSLLRTVGAIGTQAIHYATGARNIEQHVDLSAVDIGRLHCQFFGVRNAGHNS